MRQRDRVGDQRLDHVDAAREREQVGEVGLRSGRTEDGVAEKPVSIADRPDDEGSGAAISVTPPQVLGAAFVDDVEVRGRFLEQLVEARVEAVVVLRPQGAAPQRTAASRRRRGAERRQAEDERRQLEPPACRRER